MSHFSSGHSGSAHYSSGHFGRIQAEVIEIPEAIGGGAFWGHDQDKKPNHDTQVIMMVIEKFLEEVNLEL
jgi:hypothetical protein